MVKHLRSRKRNNKSLRRRKTRKSRISRRSRKSRRSRRSRRSRKSRKSTHRRKISKRRSTKKKRKQKGGSKLYLLLKEPLDFKDFNFTHDLMLKSMNITWILGTEKYPKIYNGEQLKRLRLSKINGESVTYSKCRKFKKEGGVIQLAFVEVPNLPSIQESSGGGAGSRAAISAAREPVPPTRPQTLAGAAPAPQPAPKVRGEYNLCSFSNCVVETSASGSDKLKIKGGKFVPQDDTNDAYFLLCNAHSMFANKLLTGVSDNATSVEVNDSRGYTFSIESLNPRPSSGGGSAALPDGWVERFSQQHNRPFWVNQSTGESTWTRPRRKSKKLNPPPIQESTFPEGTPADFDQGARDAADFAPRLKVHRFDNPMKQ